MPLDKELEEEIKKGVKLQKPDENELKQAEEDKKKRMEEIQKLKEKLGKQE